MAVLDCFSLKGKTAFVTGASRGIGRSIAEGLAEAGADIIGVSSSLGTPGSKTEEAIHARGRRFFGYSCDFSDLGAVRQLGATVIEEHGVPDLLVNNAGTIRRAPAVEHSVEDWEQVIDVNLNAQFYLTQAIGRGMVERGSGKVVFIASLLSFKGGITVPGYAASKGAIAQLTKALANEWAARGVNVNAIAPGYIATDNTAALRADPKRNDAILARIPAARWGDAEDLQGAAVFLCSEAARYVNGEILVVDGGWMGR